MLVRCADSVVHIVRLGLLQLPGPFNPAPLYAAQAALLAALSAADARAARQAIYRIVEIPLTCDTALMVSAMTSASSVCAAAPRCHRREPSPQDAPANGPLACSSRCARVCAPLHATGKAR